MTYAETDTETRPAAEIVRELVAKRKAEDDDRRRVAIARLTEQDIITFLDLPEGYEVVGVHAEWDTRSIGVMVRSKELAPVAVGARAPDVDGSWNREIYVEAYTGVDADDDLRKVRRPWYRMGWSPTEVPS